MPNMFLLFVDFVIVCSGINSYLNRNFDDILWFKVGNIDHDFKAS